MNPAAILSRLKPNFGALKGGLRIPLPFLRRKKVESEPEVNTWGEEMGAAEDTPRRRLPWGTIGGTLGILGAVGGLGAWLWLNADATTAHWLEQIPSVTVEVKGGTVVAKAEHGPAKDGHGTEHAGDTPPEHGAEQGAGHADAKPAAPAAPAGPITLTPAPATGLVEESARGPLPRIAEDGRKPWQVYARPFPSNSTLPRVAIVIGDMGMSGVTTGNTLQRLPPEVTLGFVPHAERLESWVERAREKGHEVVLSVPMEPLDYPRSDPGTNALLTRLPPDRNVDRLEWALGRFLGYIGVMTVNGGKFVSSPDALKPILDVIAARGLLYLDPGLSRRPPGPPMAKALSVPRAMVDLFIDRDLSRGSIDEQLKELITLAKENGAAVGVGLPYPTTIERVDMWSRTLQDHGVVLAPLSAVVGRQKQLDEMPVPTLEGGVPVKSAPPLKPAAAPSGDHGAGGNGAAAGGHAPPAH